MVFYDKKKYFIMTRKKYFMPKNRHVANYSNGPVLVELDHDGPLLGGVEHGVGEGVRVQVQDGVDARIVEQWVLALGPVVSAGHDDGVHAVAEVVVEQEEVDEEEQEREKQWWKWTAGEEVVAKSRHHFLLSKKNNMKIYSVSLEICLKSQRLIEQQ